MIQKSLWNVWLNGGGKAHIAFHEIETNKTFSGHDLSCQALEYAKLLAPIGTGMRIALAGRNQASWLARFLAIQKHGCSAVLLDPECGAYGLQTSAKFFRAKAILHQDYLEVLSNSSGRVGESAVYKTTSGSSGKPKLVPCSAAHLCADGENIIKGMRLKKGDRQLGLIPFGHSYGLGNLILPLILQGTPIWAARRFVIFQIFDWIRTYKITSFPSVPTVLDLISKDSSLRTKTSLRLVVSAGSVLEKATCKKFFKRFGVKIHNFYGSSETGGICYDSSGNAGLTGRTIGRSLPGVNIWTDRNKRIWVQGKAVVTRSGRLRMPDFGALHFSGRLELLGRVRSVAVVGSKKVCPQEVEDCLKRIEGVRNAVVAIQKSKGRDYLVAWVEGRGTQESIRRKLLSQLPLWKSPRRILFLKSIPITERGKTDYSKLEATLLRSEFVP